MMCVRSDVLSEQKDHTPFMSFIVLFSFFLSQTKGVLATLLGVSSHNYVLHAVIDNVEPWALSSCKSYNKRRSIWV